jgi:hypothetical protein
MYIDRRHTHQSLFNPIAPPARRGIYKRPAQPHGRRAQAERLDDVCPASDTAVYKDLEFGVGQGLGRVAVDVVQGLNRRVRTVYQYYDRTVQVCPLP